MQRDVTTLPVVVRSPQAVAASQLEEALARESFVREQRRGGRRRASRPGWWRRQDLASAMRRRRPHSPPVGTPRWRTPGVKAPLDRAASEGGGGLLSVAGFAFVFGTLPSINFCLFYWAPFNLTKAVRTAAR